MINSEQTNESNSVDMIRCSLYCYGCTKLFSQTEVLKHMGSQEHVQTLIGLIGLQRSKYEEALIDLAMNPLGVGEPLSTAAVAVNNYEQYMAKLTNDTVETFQQTNSTNAVANISSNLDQIYHDSGSPSRALIEQMDRDPNHEHDLESHQAEFGLNATVMDTLSNSIATSSTDDPVYHHMGQNQGRTIANEQQSTVQFHEHINGILLTELNSKPVSTDGYIIWDIHNISEKIRDAISRKKIFIDSPPFQTAMHGHRLWARLYLNGRTNPKFMSVYVYLNFPINGSFSGTIKFVLFDQSSNEPLEHKIKDCSGEIKYVNGYLGFDDFVDKNLLHKEGNPYVRDDTIYILVNVKQTIEQKFANVPKSIPENVRNFLMSIQQMS